MSAVFVALAALLGKGDRVVSSRALFGSCFVILDEILPRWGVESVFVDGADLDQWREALSEPTAAVFFETPSNPMQELVDIAAVSELAHAAGAKVVVDNVFGTPVFSKPFEHGADIVVYSATKHIDGQGRVLGGAVLGPKEFIDGPVQNLMRHTGPVDVALQRLGARQGARDDVAARRADGGQRPRGGALPRVAPARSPGSCTPSSSRTRSTSWPSGRCTAAGTVVTFELDGGKDEAFALMNALQVIDISNNLGDSKSLITHPATTTHRRLTPEARAAVGITDGVLRVSVGLEDVRDLVDDLRRALGLTGHAHVVGRVLTRRRVSRRASWNVGTRAWAWVRR